MNGIHEAETEIGFDKPPFLYEIRVQGRLSADQWAAWFDDLVISTSEGESTLQGRAVDHAALYGLLARLQDLAVPLIAVKVLDADAQLELARQSRRYDLLINILSGSIYLAVLGGLIAVTAFVAPIILPALALAFLFALLGALAHAFWLWSDLAVWRWLTYFLWPAAAVSFLIFIPMSGVLPRALGVAVASFFTAGGLLYALYALRRRGEGIKHRLAGGNLPYTGEDEAATERDSPSAD